MFDFKMFRGTVSLVLCLLLVFPFYSSAVDTSRLSISTLEDTQGNSVGENSKIAYRAIENPPARPTECSNCIGDVGIRPFFDSAKTFSHVVGAKDYPYDMIHKLYDNRMSEVTDDYQKVIKDNIGIVICLTFGILFTIIFPIVGCCFGCCRCCGNCGGSRKTDGLAKEGYARPCLSVSLFILTLFVIVGSAMLFKSNDSISDGLHSAHDDFPTNLDSLVEYFNDATKVIDTIATVDLNFTRSVVFRDLENIGYIFGGAVRDNLNREIKPYIDKISTSVKKMDAALGSLAVQLPAINKQISVVTDKINKYAVALKTITTDYDIGMAPVTAPNIDTKIDSAKLTPFDGITELNKVGNLTKTLEDSQTEIDDIPEKVQNDSVKAVTDLKSSIMDYTASVTDNTDDLDFTDKIDTDEIKDKITEYTDKALEYDKNRKYGGQGLAAIILLISLLLLLGLIFGVCGSSGSTLPHQRGCTSNCGGNILMAKKVLFSQPKKCISTKNGHTGIAVVLTFIFGSLLMLMTTLLFVVGSPIENFVCVAVEDTSIIDKLIDDHKLLGRVEGEGTYLGDKILDDPNKNMTLSEVLAACRNNEAMYKAFRVNESNLFNISEILDYKSKFSMKDDISTINVDFSKITILTPALEQNLKDFKKSIKYDFVPYEKEVNKDATSEAKDFLNTLRTKILTATVAQKAVIKKAITGLDTTLKNQGRDLQDSVKALKDQMEKLKGTIKPTGKPTLSDEIALMQTTMSELDDNLEPAGNKSFDQGLKYFTDRVYGTVDTFIDRFLYALDHDIGKCGPVWNTYSGILIDSFCGTLVASLNGFWYAIGWSLFFLIPSIIVAVKLAKYFRTMRLDDSSEKFICSDPMEMQVIPDSKAPPHFSNKVAPYDRYQEQDKLYW